MTTAMTNTITILPTIIVNHHHRQSPSSSSLQASLLLACRTGDVAADHARVVVVAGTVPHPVVAPLLVAAEAGYYYIINVTL
jgi:hypothetical protein